MKKLPIGIQTFKKLREEDYIYIDKTEDAYNLINKYQYVFLSRPRRFGKSLFADTLQNIFEGNKELFNGLYIYDKYDFEKHPVIKINFAGNSKTKEGLQQVFENILKRNQERLGIQCDEKLNPSSCFALMIRKSYRKYGKSVVIIVDEYDKPILDNLNNTEMAIYAKDELKAFYEIIKDNDEYIRFAFLTGVSKFSKVSIFSGLNNIEDISLNPRLGNICGYTHLDLQTSFAEHLSSVNYDQLQEWYDGYNFLKDKVYNPFDILLFIRNDFVFRNYWFETGTPTFLIDLIKSKKYFLPNFENITIGEEILRSFEIENIQIEVLLYQAGYLTIDKVEERPRGGIQYKLKIPNKEVQLSFSDVLLNIFIDSPISKNDIQNKTYIALQDGDLKSFEESLKSLFASIPYNNYTKNEIASYEGFYASVVYAYIASLGLRLIAEDVTNKGRIDLTVFIENKIYIIEFKVGAENALQQIKEKNYSEKYLEQNKEVYLVGINFDEKERCVSGFEWERGD